MMTAHTRNIRKLIYFYHYQNFSNKNTELSLKMQEQTQSETDETMREETGNLVHSSSQYGTYSVDGEHIEGLQSEMKRSKRFKIIAIAVLCLTFLATISALVLFLSDSNSTNGALPVPEPNDDAAFAAEYDDGMNQVISQETWDELSASFECASSVVTPLDGIDALADASNSKQSVYDFVSSSGVIYIGCSSDIQIAWQWILDNYDAAKVSIRSSGYSFGGYNKANQNIIFDVSNLKDIEIKSDEIVSIEPGVTMQEWLNFVADNKGIYTFNVSVYESE